MKISEMTCDQATTALLRLSGPFSRLCDEEEITKMLDEITDMKTGKVPVSLATAKMIPKFVTFALAKHKADLYEIVGALLMKPAAEVGKMNIKETIDAVRESSDDILTSFFPQSANVMRNKGGRSSAASPGTAGAESTR